MNDRYFVTSELRRIKSLGLIPVNGSGCYNSRSDGFGKGFRLECKCTVTSVLLLKQDWFKKIRNEALRTGLLPLMSLSFVNGYGISSSADDFISCRTEDIDLKRLGLSDNSLLSMQSISTEQWKFMKGADLTTPIILNLSRSGMWLFLREMDFIEKVLDLC